MTKQYIVSAKFVIIAAVTAFLIGLIPTTANAANEQATTSSSEIFSGSAQSGFQDAGFQQSGSSAATTAAGSASALRETTTGKIVVTGAPANQATAGNAISKTTKLWFTFIFLISAIGLVMVSIYSKRAKSRQFTNETSPAEAITEDIKPKTESKASKVAEPEKKKKTTKKKNKKHHR